MEIRNVLVPVDFSPASRFAVDYGVSLARAFHSRLTLLHVVEFPALGYVFPVAEEFSARDEYKQAVRLLSALLGPEDQDDLDLQIRILRGGVGDEIRSAIRSEKADIVVMGTHGRGLIQRLLVGSVTEHLLRKLEVPVLTVSRDAPPIRFSRILFATDLYGALRDGFSTAMSIALKMSSELVILHALEPLPLAFGAAVLQAEVESEKNDRIEDARRKLTALEAEGAGLGVNVRTELADGPAAEKILEMADLLRSDLIVLSVRDRGRLERAILGTTAERVVRDAGVPVLSVPIPGGDIA